LTARIRPLHREPLVVALVLLNMSLGGLILYKESSTPRGGPPPRHPDAPVPGTMPAEGTLPPNHPDISGGGEMSPELAAVAAAARGDEAPASDVLSISGTVKLSAELKSKWPAGSPVFVIARSEKGGPPFAVRRYDGVKAPFKYELGSGDVMLAGSAAPKRLAISVRVDQDGDAMTRQLGDLEGGPASVGPSGSVDVTVDRPAQLTR
jgi:hypothetical protein